MHALRKQTSKKIFSIFLIISLFTCFFAFAIRIDFQKCKISDNSQDNVKNILNIPLVSNYWNNFSFIHINGNWSNGVALGWIKGDGTPQNPYVIENMTINGGSSLTKNGIYIQNSKNDYFVIRNCTIYNVPVGIYYAAIRLENTCNGTIISNNCSYNYANGIILYSNSNNNTIDSNFLHKNSGQGGIYVYGSHNNTITGNIATNNTNGIILQSSTLNELTDNQANNNSNRGFYLWSSDNNYMGNNHAEQNRGSGNGDGIVLQNSKDNIVEKNIFNANTENGINIWGNQNNSICRNQIQFNGHNGILLSSAPLNNIFKNAILNNSYTGINLTSNSYNNNVDFNVIENNSQYGLKIDSSNGSIISRNVIKNNTIIGIYMTETEVYDTLIYKNVFIGNGLHAKTETWEINHWNISNVGNYWDNITGVDDNNDGLLDSTTYSIPKIYFTINVDFLPIMGDPRFNGDKIHIDDTGVSNYNWAWTSTRLWCVGTGTQSDPYIIDDLEVIGDGSGSVIMIGNSTKHFVISNCNITDSGEETGTHDSGISTWDCFNGKIMNCRIYGNLHGVYTRGGGNLIIRENIIESNSYFGIDTLKTNNTLIESNTIRYHSGGYGMYIEDCKGVNIIDNEITNSALRGIDLYYSSGCFVLNNLVKYSQMDGIYSIGNDNNTINFNELISNVLSGIEIANSGNNTIFQNIIKDNGQYGIKLFNGGINMNFNKILNNSIVHNDFTGIYIDGAVSTFYVNDTSIIGNNISDNGYTGSDDNDRSGIYIEDYCSQTIIQQNTINNNSKEGIYYQNYIHSSIIYSNTISLNLNYGIRFSNHCDNNKITNNNIFNNTFGVGLLNRCRNTTISSNMVFNNSIIGILVYICNYTIIQDNNNTISNNGMYGVLLWRSNHSEIIFNRIVNNPIGILLNESNYNNVSFNDLTGNGDQVYLDHARLCCILNNNITSGKTNGIFLSWSDNNTINNNEIISNAESGIRLSNGGNNTIYKNTIKYNGLYGLYLTKDASSFTNFNQILNNSISLNNYTGIYIDGGSLYINETVIFGNNITSNGHTAITGDKYRSGIYIYNYCSQSLIRKNLIRYNTAHGIFLEFFIDNTFIDSNLIDFNLKNGIKLFNYCTNDSIAGNIIFNHTIGINLWICQNTTISSNTINNNSLIGIIVTICNYTTIRDNNNTISNNAIFGIYLWRSNHSEIVFNRIINNPVGVYLNESNYNNVSFNDLTRNDDPYEDVNGINNYIANNIDGSTPGNGDDDDSADDDADDDEKEKSTDLNSTLILVVAAIVGSVAISGAIVAKKKKSKKVSEISHKILTDSQSSELKIAASKKPLEGDTTIIKASELKNTEAGLKAKRSQGFKPESGKENVLTAAELAEIQQTESEVDIEKKEVICIVHKGPIDGAIYLCPKCKTYYCFKCAQALKEKGEKCWSCESDIKV